MMREIEKLLLNILLLLSSSNVLYGAEVSEEECRQLPDPVYLEPGKHPTTALASFQGSGNTWMRQTLAAVSGIKVGDVYSSYGNDIFPEFSSQHDDTVLASKTHMWGTAVTDTHHVKRAVLIIRNPLDALYAEFNRMYGGNKTGYANYEHLYNSDHTPTWKWDVWMTRISSWIDFYKSWIVTFTGKVHIVYYNNLKKELRTEVKDILNFLKIPIDEKRLECALRYPKPPYFKRNKPPVIDKKTLFLLHHSKDKKAQHEIKEAVRQRFCEGSDSYKKFDLEMAAMT